MTLNNLQIQQTKETLFYNFAQDSRMAHQVAVVVTLTLAALIFLWTLLNQTLSIQANFNSAFIIHLFAESVALYVLLRVGISLPVIARFLPERTFLELWVVVVARVRKAWLRALAFKRLDINLMLLAYQQVKVVMQQLWQRQCLHPPGLWSQSQAPLFLFQQTPLLFIP